MLLTLAQVMVRRLAPARVHAHADAPSNVGHLSPVDSYPTAHNLPSTRGAPRDRARSGAREPVLDASRVSVLRRALRRRVPPRGRRERRGAVVRRARDRMNFECEQEKLELVSVGMLRGVITCLIVAFADSHRLLRVMCCRVRE